ncbi:General stress protein 13 [Rubripirellula lacrimiformis]|uniref:General stress protein 13 n=1 Tax=Rubripirellula lacrimiformis TaxID=1930273 RepID=A0A517NH44_9BACT|nr:S1 RNA-binding domain-containing protein [Rubripirellula lacrimiformis]QDT06455.1 General stress protein 13 [Rubripirellula lacrimiformis]
MSVDLEAIAQRGRCEISSLRLALPLLEQGYTPPFLARYRRDELGGLDESSLWGLASAVTTENQISNRREQLQALWDATALKDPAIGYAIGKANSVRMLSRLARRLKHESSEKPSDATRLAVRVLNPRKGDGSDFASIAAKVEGIESVDAAFDDLDNALVERLAGDPRVINAAVRWLAKNARIHIAKISDPHIGGEEEEAKPKKKKKKKSANANANANADKPAADTATDAAVATADGATDTQAATEATPPGDSAADPAAVVTTATETPAASATETSAIATAAAEAPAKPESTDSELAAAAEATATEATATEAPATEATAADAGTAETPAAEAASTEPVATEPTAADAPAAADGTATPAGETANTDSLPIDSFKAESAKSGAGDAKAAETSTKGNKPVKKQKKISPRQRRRRWLVGVLKPLQGKRFTSDKLSSFQLVMLGRALRSQVAECGFEYDAGKLVAELQRTAAGFNHHLEERMRDIVLQNEASIREAAEIAWWDDVQERASARLVQITADHLRRHVNRGPVDAKVVMSIDAVGPRTAATTIVSADGRVLHTEDLPCQLSATQRGQAVARMGELIHTHHVDLIVISNGPARRATMIALGDLITASPEKSIRWTLADRSGADAYSGSSVSDQEMRSTPRRFRAAAWLAFSVLQPAQSMAKVDPLKLRLSSFQRELSDEALAETLEDVMVSGASRGGVDANSAPQSWLRRLPGVTPEIATAIDKARREKLFSSRDAISEIANWPSAVESRQSLPFLRVFGSEESLDGTLIHPDDYALAKKLAQSLELELPPATPPGYTAPDFSNPSTSDEVKPIQVADQSKPTTVEDFTASGEKSPEFAIPEPEGDSETANTSELQADPAAGDAATPDAAATETAAAEPAAGETAEASSDAPAAEAAEPAATADDATPAEQSASGESATDDATSAEPVRQPRPDRAKIDKCVKEWQIGTRRAHQIVHWLCDPFGDSDVSGSPPAVMSTMPSTKALKPGDPVVGVVVGVMPFGVFVELAPDCSGLIHVSRVSDSYVEDLHEAVQIGDVVTAWVTGIDEKRRRVGLSAISPEREAELEDARRNRSARPHRGGGAGGGNRGGQGNRPAAAASGNRSQGTQGNQGRSGGPPSKDARGRGGQGGGGRGRSGDRHSAGNRGGRGRDKKPETYRVVAKADAKPLTDAMQDGKEPLRSFGDLMQFFDKDKKAAAEKSVKPAKPKVTEPKAAKPATEDPKPESNDAATPPATPAQTDAPATPSADTAKPADAPQSPQGEAANQPATQADTPDA